MTSLRHVSLLTILIVGHAYGYNGCNQAHGPFMDDFNAPKIQLHQIPCAGVVTETNGEPTTLVFRTNMPTQVTIRVSYMPDCDFVEITEGDHQLIPKTAFSGYGTAGGMEAYTADLNGDGTRDFVLFSYSGGCGLAGGNCNVAFVLSCSNLYRVTTVQTLFPDLCEFLLLKGTRCFVQTSFDGVDSCKDGKWHNFWIYNLVEFDGGEVRVKNKAYPGFPRIIWYSFKPNHRETDLVDEAQKTRLKAAALANIFWKPAEPQK